MSENVRKLIGVAVMAAIVVIGVVATSGNDSDFSRTRNAAFMKLGDAKPQVPEPQGLYDTASPAYIAHFQEVLPADGDGAWFMHNDRYSTLDLICYEGDSAAQLLVRVSPTQGDAVPLRAHGIVSRRAPDADAPAEENWSSGWLGQALPIQAASSTYEPQDVQAIEPPRQPLVGPWQVPLGVGAYERARLELGVFAATPDGKPQGASRIVVRLSASRDACEVDGVILRSYE